MKISIEASTKTINSLVASVESQMLASRFARQSKHAGKWHISPSEGIRVGRKPGESGPAYRLESESGDSLIAYWEDVGGICAFGRALSNVTASAGTITFEAAPKAVAAIRSRVDEAFQKGGFDKAKAGEMAPATGAYYRLDDRNASILIVDWDDGDGLAVLGGALSQLASVEILDAPEQSSTKS